jgi:hypothetical protein
LRNGLVGLSATGSAGFQVLQAVTGNIQIEGNPDLESLSLGLDKPCTLPAGGGTITIKNNDKLENLDGFFGASGINMINDANHSLVIEGNDMLSSVSSLADSDIVYFAGLTLKDNLKLESLSGMESLTGIGTLIVTGITAFPNLSDFSSLASVGTLQIVDTTTKLAGDKVTDTAGLTDIDSTRVVTEGHPIPPDFPALKAFSNIIVQRNEELTAFHLGNASLTNGAISTIDVRNNPVLATLAFPAGIATADAITIIDNSASAASGATMSVSLASLTSVSNNLQIYNNPILKTITLTKLKTVVYSVNIYGSAKLDSLDLKALDSVGYNLVINDTALAIAAFTGIGATIDTDGSLSASYLSIQNNPKITDAAANEWRTSAGRSFSSFTISGNGL